MGHLVIIAGLNPEYFQTPYIFRRAGVLQVSYQPLARKYRPKNFDDLIGQDSAVLVLKNAICMQREPSAIIFSGVRGIGKTTLARVFAKALNCPTPLAQANPCGTCPDCEAIAQGLHEDVLEIDGASNNGVDEVRSLQETVQYLPQRARCKVYIIDEVHMLSNSAFNALLKTLEEPPSQTVFIFATTELSKIPQTVVGRCQNFLLKKITLLELTQRLAWILDKEQISYDPQVLPQIARKGQGSLRDALSFLDQLIAFSAGKVDSQSLQEFGVIGTFEIYQRLLSALLQRDAALVIALIDDFEQQGFEYQEVISELVLQLRNAFIKQSLPQGAVKKQILELTDAEDLGLLQLLKQAQPLALNRLFRSLVRCLKDLTGAAVDRYIFENYCLEWCLDPGLPDIESLLQKINDKSSNEAVKVPVLATPKPSSSLLQAEMGQGSVGSFPASWDELVDIWKKKRPIEGRKLEEASLVSYSPQVIKIAIERESMLGATLLKLDEQKRFKELFASHFGFQGRFDVVAKEHGMPMPSLLEVRKTKAEEKKKQIIAEAHDHPLTKAVQDILGAKVTSIDFKESHT